MPPSIWPASPHRDWYVPKLEAEDCESSFDRQPGWHPLSGATQRGRQGGGRREGQNFDSCPGWHSVFRSLQTSRRIVPTLRRDGAFRIREEPLLACLEGPQKVTPHGEGGQCHPSRLGLENAERSYRPNIRQARKRSPKPGRQRRYKWRSRTASNGWSPPHEQRSIHPQERNEASAKYDYAAISRKSMHRAQVAGCRS